MLLRLILLILFVLSTLENRNGFLKFKFVDVNI